MRTLYDCLEAQWPINGEYIYCRKGHKLGDGRIHIRRVDRGDKLICRACQVCKDFLPFDVDYIKEENYEIALCCPLVTIVKSQKEDDNDNNKS